MDSIYLFIGDENRLCLMCSRTRIAIFQSNLLGNKSCVSIFNDQTLTHYLVQCQVNTSNPVVCSIYLYVPPLIHCKKNSLLYFTAITKSKCVYSIYSHSSNCSKLKYVFDKSSKQLLDKSICIILEIPLYPKCRKIIIASYLLCY
jgi:hypothetical protein